MIEYIIEGQCERDEDVPENAAVIRIDGKDLVGSCESCDVAILEGDDFESCAEDGGILCRKCADELRAEEEGPTRRVTHEMALDAGEPEREGMEY